MLNHDPRQPTANSCGEGLGIELWGWGAGQARFKAGPTLRLGGAALAACTCGRDGESNKRLPASALGAPKNRNQSTARARPGRPQCPYRSMGRRGRIDWGRPPAQTHGRRHALAKCGRKKARRVLFCCWGGSNTWRRRRQPSGLAVCWLDSNQSIDRVDCGDATASQCGPRPI